MKGIWLLPSRRRLKKLAVFFEHATRHGISTPGVVLVQKDELDELRAYYAALKLPPRWQIVPTSADGFGDKQREIWPAVRDLDWVGLACDDLRPQTRGWDRALLAAVNGQNIVTCNDGQQGNARMSGVTIFSGAVLRAIGYLYAPGFWHTFMDNVWEDLGRATNCWTYVDSVLITHDHPFVNQQIDPARADETTYKSYGRMLADQAAYAAWKKNDFENTCERIRKIWAP